VPTGASKKDQERDLLEQKAKRLLPWVIKELKQYVANNSENKKSTASCDKATKIINLLEEIQGKIDNLSNRVNHHLLNQFFKLLVVAGLSYGLFAADTDPMQEDFNFNDLHHSQSVNNPDLSLGPDIPSQEFVKPPKAPTTPAEWYAAVGEAKEQGLTDEKIYDLFNQAYEAGVSPDVLLSDPELFNLDLTTMYEFLIKSGVGWENSDSVDFDFLRMLMMVDQNNSKNLTSEERYNGLKNIKFLFISTVDQGDWSLLGVEVPELMKFISNHVAVATEYEDSVVFHAKDLIGLHFENTSIFARRSPDETKAIINKYLEFADLYPDAFNTQSIIDQLLLPQNLKHIELQALLESDIKESLTSNEIIDIFIDNGKGEEVVSFIDSLQRHQKKEEIALLYPDLDLDLVINSLNAAGLVLPLE